jgi:hypothetical protein
MSKGKKLTPDKSPGAVAPNGASPKGKKPDDHGKREAKPKSIAAEIDSAVKREEISAQAQKGASRPSAPETVKPAQAPAKSAAPAAKPSQGPARSSSAKAGPAVEGPAPKAPPSSPKTPATPAPATENPTALLQPEAANAKRAAKTPQLVFETAVDSFARSFREASQGTTAVNRKLMDFAQANLNASFDHAKDVAAARSPVRIMRLQMEYWHDCLETFASQALELRALSAEFVAKTRAPIRDQMRRFPATPA